jgi:hypothetical protein
MIKTPTKEQHSPQATKPNETPQVGRIKQLAHSRGGMGESPSHLPSPYLLRDASPSPSTITTPSTRHHHNIPGTTSFPPLKISRPCTLIVVGNPAGQTDGRKQPNLTYPLEIIEAEHNCTRKAGAKAPESSRRPLNMFLNSVI